jgi:hypothetical protein
MPKHSLKNFAGRLTVPERQILLCVGTSKDLAAGEVDHDALQHLFLKGLIEWRSDGARLTLTDQGREVLSTLLNAKPTSLR